MAVTVDVASTAEINGNPLTWSHTCAVGATLLLVGGADVVGNSATGITYNGVAMTREQNNADITVFSMHSPPSGAHNIVITWPSAVRHVGMAISFFGSRTASAVSGKTTTSGASTTFSLPVTSSVGSMAICFMGDHIAAIPEPSVTPGTNETEYVDNVQGGGGDDVHGWLASEPGAATCTFAPTFSNTIYDVIGLSVDAGGVPLDDLTLAASAPTLTVLAGPTSVLMDELTLAGSMPNMSLLPGAVQSVMDTLDLAAAPQTMNPFAMPEIYDRNFIRPRSRGFINIPISKTTKQ